MDSEAVTKEVSSETKSQRIEDLAHATRIVFAGFRILNHRILTLIGLLLSSVLFGWTLVDPRWERILASTLFSVGAYFMIHFGENHGP